MNRISSGFGLGIAQVAVRVSILLIFLTVISLNASAGLEVDSETEITYAIAPGVKDITNEKIYDVETGVAFYVKISSEEVIAICEDDPETGISYDIKVWAGNHDNAGEHAQGVIWELASEARGVDSCAGTSEACFDNGTVLEGASLSADSGYEEAEVFNCGDGDTGADADFTVIIEPECGNGVWEFFNGEECDETAFPLSYSCQSPFEYASGSLACNADCTIDASACSGPYCGNGTVEEHLGEECDSDAGSKSCEDMGYDKGSLGCYPHGETSSTGTNISCTYNTEGCLFSGEESGVSEGEAAGSCTDECSGDVCDSTTTRKECGDFDEDVCLEYSSPIPCADGEVCKDSTGKCVPLSEIISEKDLVGIESFKIYDGVTGEEKYFFDESLPVDIEIRVRNYSENSVEVEAMLELSSITGARLGAIALKDSINDIAAGSAAVFIAEGIVLHEKGASNKNNYELRAEAYATDPALVEGAPSNNWAEVILSLGKLEQVTIPELPLAVVAVVGLLVLAIVMRN